MKNLIILGSGRSGTSMAAGMFSNSGYFMGERHEYLKASSSNPKGFYEDYEVNTINEDILKKTVPNFPEKIRRRFFSSYTFYRARWLARIPLDKKINSDMDVDTRIKKCTTRQLFCYKDPRFSYTLPAWQKFLSKDTQYLVVYRHPYQTSESIIRECSETPALRKLKMNRRISLGVWRDMYSHILRHYENSSQKQTWCFMHFDQFFEYNQLKKLGNFTNAKVDTSFADRKLSRTSIPEGIRETKLKAIYSRLNTLAKYEP